MRILLVANYQIDQQESMQRFASLMQEGLVARGHYVRIAAPVPRVGQMRMAGPFVQKWLGYVDKLVAFPNELRRAARWADVVHILDHSNSPYTSAVAGRPHVVTCHDLLAVLSARGHHPENPTGHTGRLYQAMIERGLARARAIACVSEATRDDLMKTIPRDPSSVTVIPNGLNYPYRPMERLEAEAHTSALGLPATRPYFLHVGGNQWYKNRAGVLRIFAELASRPETQDHAFIMAGKPFTPALRSQAEETRLGERLLELNGVPSEGLRALYSMATALMFPSLAEGFGWPVAEALACGCPVFTSNRAPMTEVGGDAAAYLDPERPGEAADRIVAGVNNAPSMRQRGLERAREFAPELMIARYEQLYRELAA